MNILSSREIAVAFWTVAVLIGVLSAKNVRASALVAVRQALFTKLVFVWLSLAAYSLILVIGLREFGLWNSALLKDTLIWFVFCAITYPLQFHDPQKASRVFRVLFRDSLSVLIVVEVLVETYTFSLPIELIIVPSVTLIAMVGTVAEMSEEDKLVGRILENIQAVVGIAILMIAVRQAAADPGHIFVATLLSSLIVVVLSLACWPYICFLRLAFAYETLLSRIGWKKDVSRVFRHFAAFNIVRFLQFRSAAVAPFIRRNAFKLNNVVDKDTLQVLLDDNRKGTVN